MRERLCVAGLFKQHIDYILTDVLRQLTHFGLGVNQGLSDKIKCYTTIVIIVLVD